MKKPSKFMIESAKRSMFGRLVCRLLGDQTGAVMMEYVVIGVLVVAAAVAMVLLFGKQIRNQFGVMNKAVVGDASGAAKMAQDNYEKTNDNVDNAMATGDTTANQSSAE